MCETISICDYMYVHACVYVMYDNVQIVYMYACICICAWMYICVRMLLYVCMYIYVSIVNTHTHIYIYICMSSICYVYMHTLLCVYTMRRTFILSCISGVETPEHGSSLGSF